MTQFDPHRSWGPLAERAAAETNPRRKQLLIAVRDHMEHEIKGHLEPLMATLTAAPVYHFRGAYPAMTLTGREAVTEFYRNMIAAGGNNFEVLTTRIVVDDDAVVTEGAVKQVYPGKALIDMGKNEVDGKPVDAEARYLSTTAIITVWPADPDGKLIGEDIYFGDAPLTHLERL